MMRQSHNDSLTMSIESRKPLNSNSRLNLQSNLPMTTNSAMATPDSVAQSIDFKNTTGPQSKEE